MTISEKITILKEDGFISSYVDEDSIGLDNRDLNIRAIIRISSDSVIFLRHYDDSGKIMMIKLSFPDHLLLEEMRYKLINRDLEYGFYENKNRRD